MRFQKIILYLFLATLAVGCDRYGGFSGCWGCDGFWGCDQWDIPNDYFINHQSALPFSMYFSVQGIDRINPTGPSVNGTTNSDALASFGIQRFFTNHIAMRAFLTFNRFSEGNKVDSLNQVNSAYGLGLGLLYYFDPLYNIATYIGAGVGYRTATFPDYDQPDRAGNEQSPQGVSIPPGKTTLNAFGITTVAGFDWYLTPNFAIGSEYALGFSSISTTFKANVTGTETDRGTATSLGIAPAGNLHMLIHF